MTGASGGLPLELSALNLSLILSIVDGYSLQERQVLYRLLNVKDTQGIIDLYSQSSNNEDVDPSTISMYINLADYISLYVPPVLIVLGVCGNLLSLIILLRRCMRRYSTYIYLAVLSVTDTLVLTTGLLLIWIGKLVDQDIRGQADWLCKASNAIGYTVSDFSVWLILAVTFERYVAVCHPLKAARMTTKSRAIKVILTLLIILLATNAHFWWTIAPAVSAKPGNSTQNNTAYYMCDGKEPYKTLVNHVWPWVDACIYSFLPFLILVFFNSLIIRQVLRARNLRDKMQGIGVPRAKQERGTKLTIMLLTISFTFLLTTTPMNVYLILKKFKENDKDELTKRQMELFKTISEMLMYVNHSINFYVYCATGQKFRQQLVQLLCPSSGDRNGTNVTTMVSQHSKEPPCVQHKCRNGVYVKVEETEMKDMNKHMGRNGAKVSIKSDL